MCLHKNVMKIYAKSNDCNQIEINGKLVVDGYYIPRWIGIGGGDTLEFAFCTDCGQILGHYFPLPIPVYETFSFPKRFMAKIQIDFKDKITDVTVTKHHVIFTFADLDVLERKELNEIVV